MKIHKLIESLLYAITYIWLPRNNGSMMVHMKNQQFRIGDK